MKKIKLILFLLMTVQWAFAQNADDFYRKADSLYRIKEFKNAALAYAAGINLQGNTAEMRRYRSAAAAWSLANLPDSAFYVLSFISRSEKLLKFDLWQIENGLDFSALRNDQRWNPLLENIRKQATTNSYSQEEFIYGRKDGMALTLVWIKPKIKSNGKAIIAVISGSWNSGYNGIEIPTTSIEQYLARGYNIFAVIHGSQTRYPIPDNVADLKRAVRYIRFNAAKFSIDPNHIGITGTSSGGHLSLMVATADNKINTTANDPVDRVSSRVQAVAVLFPPTDLLNWGGPGINLINAKETLKNFKSWGPANLKVWNETYAFYEDVTDTSARNKIGREISPLNFVSADDPPVFIIHGDADPTVPLQQSQAIIARFKEAGVISNFIIKKGGKHNAEDMKPDWLQFADWFDKYLN